MTYSVKEIFYTLQGEGANAGRPAVFCRFAGCNLWSGREEDRGSAICRFCDTDFVGVDGTQGGKYRTAAALAEQVEAAWTAKSSDSRFVVLTGGEPLLQVDSDLIDALHRRGFQIAVETNGTVSIPEGIDWVCVSPKGSSQLVVTSGNELKVVVPQSELSLDALALLDFDLRLLQPMDGPLLKENTAIAIRHCMSDPRWRLGVQTHKLIGIR